MIGVFRGRFPGVWSGGVRVALRGFPRFDPPSVWVVALWSGDPDEDLRAMVEGRPHQPRSVLGIQVFLHRLELVYPADHPGPLESDETDRRTDRWGREWIHLTIYVEDVAAWHDRFRDCDGRTPYTSTGGRVIDVAGPLVVRRFERG